MKRLWKQIPPCMSDILGFQAVLNHTDGVGIVDDSSHYKPLQHEKKGDYRHEHGRGGRKTGGGGLSVKGKLFSGVRVVASEIEETDVIGGTSGKVREAVKIGMEQFRPRFALLTTAPCAAMIGTDLDEIADEITQEEGIPAGVVHLDGQKDYIYGISYTLEAMGKLLLEPGVTIPGTVNLLGCNTIDWPEEGVLETQRWLEGEGFSVLSRWGVEESTEHLRQAASAAVNLVVHVAGLRLARYMEREFQIPYVVGAPFGTEQCARLLEALKGTAEPNQEPEPSGGPEALVIGEQMEGNALRNALLAQGFQRVQVCSFFEMDKQEMRPGDKKLTSEDELKALLESGSLRVVLGDPDYRMGRDIPWIALANRGNNAPSEQIDPVPLVGEQGDLWLKERLAKTDMKK